MYLFHDEITQQLSDMLSVHHLIKYVHTRLCRYIFYEPRETKSILFFYLNQEK